MESSCESSDLLKAVRKKNTDCEAYLAWQGDIDDLKKGTSY